MAVVQNVQLVTTVKTVDLSVSLLFMDDYVKAYVNAKEKEAALSLQQVIVASSASTVVSMVIVFICVFILRRLLCKKQRSNSAGTSNEFIFTNHNIRAPLSIPQEHVRITQTSAFPESQYETVDESNMIENSNVRIGVERSALRNTSISSSSSDSKTSNASGVAADDTEGYLHPYHTLEENWQNRGYPYSPCIVKNKSHSS
ncbi:Hypothetical predicted protein [Mytilus galloprovincialis]|uniref:Uncharacterized protein n=1 Tax=Mytilus galloprovincialis TaxID=29158 RepID=A0A8B6D3A5_MYTGA|nr:Hypothetical predicted protein [Mytilus galloprovincialis]